MPWANSIERKIVALPYTDNKIRLIWCTDSHVNNTIGHQLETNLKNAVADCRLWKPNAFVMTGDMGGTIAGSGPTIRTHLITKTCLRPVYFAIGNHDEEELTLGKGNPNTTVLECDNAWNKSAPFYETTQLVSGDGTFKIRLIVLDWNFYHDGGGASGFHTNGDRIGLHTDYAGPFRRQFGSEQLAWVQSALQSDNSSDAILFMVHAASEAANYTNDSLLLGDILHADGRPCVGLSGHFHQENGKIWNQNRTGNFKVCDVYECPSMQEYECWARVTLSKTNLVESMVLKNYIGGGPLVPPFTSE